MSWQMLWLLGVSALTIAPRVGAQTEADPVDSYDVIWDTPGENSSASMPLGNGEIGLNVWTERDALLFYIARTDAWSENARLLKLGRMRIALSPTPLVDDGGFVQRLRLRRGEIEVTAGAPGQRAAIRVWVDAGSPVIHVEVDGQRPVELQVDLELWRNQERRLEGPELFSAYGVSDGPDPVIVYPDFVLPAADGRLTWYHRNESSIWPECLQVQGLAQFAAQAQDPLLHRTFGGTITGDGLVATGERALRSEAPATRHHIMIVTHTAQTAAADQWVREVDALAAQASASDLEGARAAHRAWWAAFWDRSYIRLSGHAATPRMTTNALPLRLGADSDGANQFRGHIARARVFSRGLTAQEIAHLAAGPDAALQDSRGLLGDWRPGQLAEGVVPNSAGDGLEARAVGQLAVETVDGVAAARFGGAGWLQAAPDTRLDLTQAVTLDAWVRPEELPEGGGRIIDKSQAGTANGFLLDTFPGNSLRMIAEPNTLSHSARLAPDKWTHVAAVFDPSAGGQVLYVDGKPVATHSLSTGAESLGQAYALQRFISACAGRGHFPIKFNGSLFTVDSREPDEVFDADYRRWGGPYWFQNTRLAYWPMLASGDLEMMDPLFDMYRQALPLARARTREYFGHAGAFFPETMYFWGAYATDNYGWNREGKPASHVDNTYIRHYFDGALELLALMLDRYAFTQDDEFANRVLLPLAAETVEFYDHHYRRDEAGKLLIEPSQALETRQQAVNPLPPIAGLRFVLPQLLTLPGVDANRREQWRRLLADLPQVPLAGAEGGSVLAPAQEILQGASNSENPELYAIFPYRLYGAGKPGLDMARRSFAQRRVKGNRGWQQDDTQAALLGLAQEAGRMVAERMGSKHAGSRFPVFWGPNFDWIPDQDHGTNGLMALQSMLLQWDGDRILLLPAWPRDWDVEFRLHAPKQTVVEGVVRDGVLQELRVTPPERSADVEVVWPQ